jgi:signal transduction histidine kinase
MSLALRDTLPAFGRFLRTPTLSRTVVGLLSLALILMLAINIATFVMIRRTAEFNETVEKGQSVRLLAKDALTRLVDAETGQRGFLLTGREEYLRIHDEAIAALPPVMERLDRATLDDPDLAQRLLRIGGLAERRLRIMEESIALAREGRIGEAVQIVRSGEGKVLMDAMRDEVAAIDEIEATRLQFRTRQSEWASGMTAAINALGGALILVLAGMSAWLIRRYVLEIQEARDALDAANASLEGKVRDRTAALTRANEEIQRFAYIVSHDLRAPLVNVMGYTSELEQAGKALELQINRLETTSPDLIEQDAVIAVREDVPEAIGFIRASTGKMDRLINAILKLSRDGRRNLTPEPLDMTEIAQTIADSVRHQTDAAEAEIVVSPLPGLISDRLAVEQILGNLIDNAVKYLDTSRPGHIRIEGDDLPGGSWVEYRVVDNGRGISDRDHERIFELFRRSGRQDRPGEGLGLAFVRNSARRLGGDVEIESELGKGSTFRLKFPKRLVLSETGDTL